MVPKCETAVRARAKEMGRALTDSDLRGIDSQIVGAMRRLAKADPEGWISKPLAERQQLAAEAVMADIHAEAARKLENAERQILITAEVAERVERLQESQKGSRAQAFKADMQQTDHLIKNIRAEASGQLMATMEAAGDKKGAGLGRKVLMTVFDAENPVMARDLVREVFGQADGRTGNQAAQIGAKAWLDTIEGMRQRFNAAGGDVRALAYGYVPQPHDIARVHRAGREAWADKTLPLLDRKQYLNEDGSRMGDDQVRDLLRKAWDTISSEGQNKTEPGQYQSAGKRANKGTDERQLHFADGDAYMDYMADFGRGPMFDAMLRHIGGVARDIGLVERYGPDPAAQARLQIDLASRADGPALTKAEKAAQAFTINPQTYWDIISGKTGMPAEEGLAVAMADVRNLMTAAKLGSAILSSFADLGTIAITTGYNRLSHWQLMKDIGAAGSKEGKEFMSAHAMISEAAQNELSRWSGDFIGANWSGKLANSVMKWSLLNAWSDGLRQGFKMTMNAGMARMAKKPWNQLDAFDQQHLTRAGFSEADWAVLNKVAPTSFRGRELLTPESIRAHGDANLANRVMGFVQDESEYAVVNPDIRTRSIVTFGGKEAGSMAGEIGRTVMQFKSFPIAMLTRHWSRAMEGNPSGGPLLANRYVYASAMMVTLMGMGAITTQVKQMISGQDPINMDPTKKNGARFWAKALATGGAMGVAGDLLLIDPSNSATDTATTVTKNLAGPTVGAATELLLKLGVENAWQAAAGKDTHAAAEAASWVKSNTPGASLWWVKPMIEHGFMNQLNENLSPGYLGKLKQRSMKNWGTGYWWDPNEVMPDRAPDLGKAVGQ